MKSTTCNSMPQGKNKLTQPAAISVPQSKSNSTHADVLNGRPQGSTADVLDGRPQPSTAAAMYGYVRVSSREQNEARQIDAMRAFGVPKNHIFLDKQSGKDFDRPAYQALLAALKPNDTLVVKSIDRLGRNYEEILEQWRIITKEKEAAIVVIDMPLLDTRSNRDLTGTLIADIVLQLLSYVAETERAFIKQRQKEGIAAAKARGKRFGPPLRKRPNDLPIYVDLWVEQRITAREASRRLHIAHTTFLKWAREILTERGYTQCEKGLHPVAPVNRRAASAKG